MSELRPERLHMQDLNHQPIVICGRTFIADLSGALYWPAENALIIADLALAAPLHATARNRHANQPPPKEALVTLAKTIDQFNARTIIVLGIAPGRAPTLDPEVAQILQIMQEDCEWIWLMDDNSPAHLSSAHGRQGVLDDAPADKMSDDPISNNFDRASTHRTAPPTQGANPFGLGGTCLTALHANSLTLRHTPMPHCNTHEIAAQMRPAARLSNYGHIVRRPCFIGNGARLILPAFASFSGGNNVLGDEFTPLLGQGGLQIWILGQDGVYPISSRRLAMDEGGE